MTDWLDLVIYFIGSGDAFFAGGAALLLGLGISALAVGSVPLLIRNLAVLLGIILIAISAVPLPWWMYALLASAVGIWLPLEWCKSRLSATVILVGRAAVLIAWLIALATELPYHFTPTLPAQQDRAIFVIGDSVSAGVQDGEKGTWPELLAKQRDLDLKSFAKMGATVGSARKQAERIGDGPALVLLEIGGNDLLGSTTPEEFEERLDALLAEVCRDRRSVVMLELPLPPFRNEIGMIQRRLAEKHGVYLIPRRIFIGVLTTAGATIDGIHLSPAGHEQMAEAMWQAIRSGYVGE